MTVKMNAHGGDNECNHDGDNDGDADDYGRDDDADDGDDDEQGPFTKTPVNVRIAAKVSRLVQVGLRLLQRWSCVVLECMAWKHTHPCSQESFLRAGGDLKGKGMEYERVVRYNWSANELSAIVEVGRGRARPRTIARKHAIEISTPQ